MKIAIIAITKQGERIGQRIEAGLPESRLYFVKGGLLDFVGGVFGEYDGIVFCMALGIVVRVIAPYLKDKYTDPAVVTVDEGGRFAVSALSGHEGGANRLAIDVANVLDAEPVISTASEAVKNVVVGIGCRKGVKKEAVIEAIEYALRAVRLFINKLRCVATIDLKKDEEGLKEACLEMGVPLRIISSKKVKNFKGSYHRSSFVQGKIGVEGVCEPCALLAGRGGRLILPKLKFGGITVAVAVEEAVVDGNGRKLPPLVKGDRGQ